MVYRTLNFALHTRRDWNTHCLKVKFEPFLFIRYFSVHNICNCLTIGTFLCWFLTTVVSFIMGKHYFNMQKMSAQIIPRPTWIWSFNTTRDKFHVLFFFSHLLISVFSFVCFFLFTCDNVYFANIIWLLAQTQIYENNVFSFSYIFDPVTILYFFDDDSGSPLFQKFV